MTVETRTLSYRRAPAVRSPGESVSAKYVLERPLAEGGMGSLWVARHEELDVAVAIKFSSLERSAAHDARFRREARATARLKSPHVVHVYDYGIDRDEPYIAMELLEGKTVKELLDVEPRLPLARVVSLMSQVVRGLRVAHEAGIVHRDLKPSNLFLARSGHDEVLKILDFGIAKAGTDLPRDGSAQRGVSGDATRLGAVLGSPGYMSPEQARGEVVDARSDLWSLAVVAFRMLTGEELFPAGDATETASKICLAPLPRSTNVAPDLPAELDDFFARALARPKDQRFQSAQEFLDALSAISERHPSGPVPPPGHGRSQQVALSTPFGRTGETRPFEVDATPAEPSRRRIATRALIGVALALGLGAAVATLSRGGMLGAEDESSFSAVAAEPAPARSPAPAEQRDSNPVASAVPALPSSAVAAAASSGALAPPPKHLTYGTRPSQKRAVRASPAPASVHGTPATAEPGAASKVTAPGSEIDPVWPQ